MSTLRLDDLVVAVPAGGRRSRRIQVSLKVASGAVVVARTPGPDEVGGPASTALARAVAGLDPVIAGRVRVGGREVTGNPVTQRNVRYVPAGGGLLPHLTVEQNVRYGLDRAGVAARQVGEWLEQAIADWRLVSLRDTRPADRSREERMRVALARATACLPEALVVDVVDPLGTDLLADLLGQVEAAVLVCSPLDDVLPTATSPIQVTLLPEGS